MSAYRSPLLDRAGAVPADAPDDGVAAHYGDPIREQQRLARGEGWVDLSHRDVVRIGGPDRLSWLHNLTTQRVDNLVRFVGVDALILSPQGHVEHHLQLVDDGEAVWVHVEPGEAVGLVDFLTSMRFMLRVDVDDVTASWAVGWQPSRDPSSEFLTRVEPWHDVAAGRQVFVARDRFDEFASAHGSAAGIDALEALRVAAGRPRFGKETDHRTIPHEVGWIGSAVVLDKGCYRGQETVAHVANLGRPPRRLVRLHLDGSVRETLPAKGAEVSVDGAAVGAVTTSAYHHELGPIALALVKYMTQDDAPAVVGAVTDGVAATIEAVVERDTTARPGQAARSALRGRSLL